MENTANTLPMFVASYIAEMKKLVQDAFKVDVVEALAVGPMSETWEHYVRVADYTPYLSGATSWLPTIEDRIMRATSPDNADLQPSTEWLAADAANAALAFFRSGADLLPSEPHIYATHQGDLVAEFQTKTGNLTSVITDANTILFAVFSDDPDNPQEQVIRRGSNSLRDEVRDFTRRFQGKSDGAVDTA